jgi:hypothetical protein
LCIVFGEEADKGSVHTLAKIFSDLIQQTDALSLFHNFEEHKLRRRRAGQVSMEGKLQFRDGEFGPFQHVEDKATVQGGCLVRRQRWAEPRLYLARYGSLGEDHESG